MSPGTFCVRILISEKWFQSGKICLPISSIMTLNSEKDAVEKFSSEKFFAIERKF